MTSYRRDTRDPDRLIHIGGGGCFVVVIAAVVVVVVVIAADDGDDDDDYTDVPDSMNDEWFCF